MLTAVSASLNNSSCALFISGDRRVHYCDYYKSEENEHEERKLRLMEISSLRNISSVDSGHNHVICLDHDGNVFTFGSNSYGQLGIEGVEEISMWNQEPQRLDLPPVCQIAANFFFNLCLTVDGSVYSFGYGPLGHGDSFNHIKVFIPKKIEGLEDIDLIACGASHVICKSVNTIYVWSTDNLYGAIGIKKRIVLEPFKINNWPRNIIEIKCGYEHTLVLTNKKEVFSCGINRFGQLGRETTKVNYRTKYPYSKSLMKVTSLSKIIRIICGYGHSICIDENNDLHLFGCNSGLGLGDKEDRFIPTKHPTLSNVIDISLKWQQTFVKTYSSEIYTFGVNTLRIPKQELQNSNGNYAVPVQILESNEDIWCPYSQPRLKSARN